MICPPDRQKSSKEKIPSFKQLWYDGIEEKKHPKPLQSLTYERTERYQKLEKREGQKVKNWNFPCRENWKKLFDLQ